MADHRLFCQDRRGIELFYEAVIEGADGYDDEINSGVTRVDEGIMTNPFNGIYQLSAQHDMAWGVGVKDRKEAGLVTGMEFLRDFFFENF
jgi:hypothetical protein